MIDYYEQLSDEEKKELTEKIQLLFGQTFVLERKIDRRTGRLAVNPDFRVLERHLEFVRAYMEISGIQVFDNSQSGIINIQGETLMGDKLPRLATIYVLVLKLIYDEQMSTASTSVNVYTTLGDLNERVGSFHLLKDRPSPTEIRKAVTLLKKFQIIEPLDTMEELDGGSRFIIYPSINMVLLRSDLQALLKSFEEPGFGVTGEAAAEAIFEEVSMQEETDWEEEEDKDENTGNI